MTPQSKTMKQMFQSISVVFNYQRGTVSAVQLVEKNGDKTVIVLKNVKSNQPLHADLFSIR